MPGLIPVAGGTKVLATRGALATSLLLTTAPVPFDPDELEAVEAIGWATLDAR